MTKEKMKIESIKGINITLLFSLPLNHLLIDQKELVEMYKMGDAEQDATTFIRHCEIFPWRAVEFGNDVRS